MDVGKRHLAVVVLCALYASTITYSMEPIEVVRKEREKQMGWTTTTTTTKGRSRSLSSRICRHSQSTGRGSFHYSFGRFHGAAHEEKRQDPAERRAPATSSAHFPYIKHPFVGDTVGTLWSTGCWLSPKRQDKNREAHRPSEAASRCDRARGPPARYFDYSSSRGCM